MDSGIEWFDELAKDDDALIGKCVRSFGFLERTLFLLLNNEPWMTTEEAASERGTQLAEDHAEKLVGTFGKLVEHVRNRNKDVPYQHRLSDEFIKRLNDYPEKRNLICHGSWRLTDCNKLKVMWLNKRSVKKLAKEQGSSTTSNTWTKCELSALADEVEAAARRIAAHARDSRTEYPGHT